MVKKYSEETKEKHRLRPRIPHSILTKEKISKGNLGKKFSDETRIKMSISKRKHFIIFDNNDCEIFNFKEPFLEFCKRNGLPSNALLESYRKNGEPIFSNKRRLNPGNEKFIGWRCLKLQD